MSPKKFQKELMELLVGIDDPKLMDQFLQRMLTPSEFEEVVLRLQIFKLLYSGMPQRKIAEKLGVSIGTISRGSRELKYGGLDFSKIFKDSK